MLLLAILGSVILFRKHRRHQALKLFRETHYADSPSSSPVRDLEASPAPSGRLVATLIPVSARAQSPTQRKPISPADLEYAQSISTPDFMASPTANIRQFPPLAPLRAPVNDVDPFADPVQPDSNNPFEGMDDSQYPFMIIQTNRLSALNSRRSSVTQHFEEVRSLVPS